MRCWRWSSTPTSPSSGNLHPPALSFMCDALPAEVAPVGEITTLRLPRTEPCPRRACAHHTARTAPHARPTVAPPALARSLALPCAAMPRTRLCLRGLAGLCVYGIRLLGCTGMRPHKVA